MAARQNYYNNSDAEQTTTSASYVDVVSLTFTPDASATYFIFASWEVSSTSVSVSAFTTLLNSTSSTTFSEFQRPGNTISTATDYAPRSSIGIDTFGASPASQTYKIQMKSDGSQTVKVKNARIIAIKSDPLDQSTSSATRVTTTLSAFQDALTLTFTPGSTGDYIILAAATSDDAASSGNETQITVDGVAQGVLNRHLSIASANRYPYGWVTRANLSNASHTIKIQYASATSGNTVGISQMWLVALRADTFDNNYYGSDDTTPTTASTSYVDELILTATPQAVTHVLFGAAIAMKSSTSQQIFIQFNDNGTGRDEHIYQANSSTLNLEAAAFILERFTASNASTTWKWQMKVSNAVLTGQVTGQRLSVIQLDASSGASLMPPLRIPNAKVGPMAMRHSFRRTLSPQVNNPPPPPPNTGGNLPTLGVG